MKTALIYSGKGGVGKTTTTANVAKALIYNGKKVLIIDGDINTPSMSVIYPNDHPEEHLWVHSTGHIFDNLIYFEKSMVRKFIHGALQKIKDINPDVVLIDTPPSITDVHIEIMALMKISTIILVSQPNKLSASDVIRTSKFFSQKCDRTNIYLIENMSFGEKVDFQIPCEETIPFLDGMRGDLLYDKFPDKYKHIADLISQSEDVLQGIQATLLFDESYGITRIEHAYSRRDKAVWNLYCKYDDGTEKLRPVEKLCFQNVRSWERVREELEDENSKAPCYDLLLNELTPERVSRLVDAFKADKEAYFMVTKAPNTEITVFPGEIGRAMIIADEKFYGVPRLKYQTAQGELILFAHEAIPMTMEDIAVYLNEGYKLQPDGRYIPTKQHIEMCYNAFGSRIGISDNWEDIYNTFYK
jgi:MinD-like ATPase involved in chromosome partitioning or flagellar assembly